jgi:pSer/pThr/pTyr-binding forkhead associated (FHA) protein
MLDPTAGQPAEADPNRTQFAGDIPPPIPSGFGEATQQGISVTCAVCQTPNMPGERWCRDCGFMLGATPAEVGELPDPSAQPRLVSLGNGGREFVLNPGSSSVGRENADVLIPDPQVSRQHARLILEGQSLAVEDLGSTNGTKLANRRLGAGERSELFDGDEIRFGGTSLKVVIPGGPPRPPEAAPAPAATPPPREDRGAPVALLRREDGQELPLYEGSNILGRRQENDVWLTGDPYVSGRHAEIRIAEGETVLVDLGSTNGTFIDEERLPAGEERRLTPPAPFRIGKTNLTLHAAPAGAEAAPETEAAAEEPPAEPAAEAEATAPAPGEPPAEEAPVEP